MTPQRQVEQEKPDMFLVAVFARIRQVIEQELPKELDQSKLWETLENTGLHFEMHDRLTTLLKDAKAQGARGLASLIKESLVTHYKSGFSVGYIESGEFVDQALTRMEKNDLPR